MRSTLEKIEKEILEACARSNRKRSDVHLLAVSKFQPIEKIEEAYALGLRDFGENYVQELIEKKSKLSHLKDIRWHLIGHLQSNKCKQALENSSFFHALDSEKLAKELVKKHISLNLKSPYQVFIEVNLDGEKSKTGISPKNVAELAHAVQNMNELKLVGLMCIPEAKKTAEEIRPSFKSLAEIARQISQPLQLSMGMSSDFSVAIEEGSNWIRVGTRIFGERPNAK